MKYLLCLIALLSVGACSTIMQPVSKFDPAQNAVVAYYKIYEEDAQQEKTLLAKGAEDFIKSSFTGEYFTRDKGHYKFYTYAGFTSRESSQYIDIGCVPGRSCPYTYSNFDLKVIPPGHYDFNYSIVGLENPKYDGAKCGNIGFIANPGDVIVIKGISPAAVKTKSSLGSFNRYTLPEFDMLPPDYLEQIKKTDDDIAPVIAKGKLRVIAPTSDNPAAFQKCVKENGGRGKLVPF